MEKQRSVALGMKMDVEGRAASSARFNELVEALLASVRGGEGDDVHVPGPLSCGPGVGNCIHSPCATSPSENNRAISEPAPLCVSVPTR